MVEDYFGAWDDEEIEVPGAYKLQTEDWRLIFPFE
jgi:hypothetical protein